MSVLKVDGSMNKPKPLEFDGTPCMHIFGYTWEEIKAAQQGKPISRPIPITPGDDDSCLPGDVDLLAQHGLKGLEDLGFYGVIDRLTRAGLISSQ